VDIRQRFPPFLGRQDDTARRQCIFVSHSGSTNANAEPIIMRVRPSLVGIILLGVLGLPAAGMFDFGSLAAESRPRPARTTHGEESSVEPPLASLPSAVLIPTGSPHPEDPAVPMVALRVRVPAAAGLGQEVEYHLCVENCSAAAAHHVLVRNPLPANARFVRANPEPAARDPELLWQLGTLEPGARREILLVLVPTGPGDLENCARVQFEHGQCVCTRIAQPGLQLRKQGPRQAAVNETLAFQLTVTNTGAIELSGVVVTDSLPAGLEHASRQNALRWDVGTLAPGQSRTLEYHVVAKRAGRLCNRSVAVADGGLRQEAESCVTVGEAKLTLAKTGPERGYVKSAAAYQLTVRNAGILPLANVVLVDPVPSQMSFVSSRGGHLLGNEVRWSIGALEPEESRTVDVVLRAQSAGKICNRAAATADRGLRAEAEACTEFVGVPALLLEVVDTDDPVEVGAETSYIILVRNQGTVPATSIRIEAEVPAQMEVFRVTGPADHLMEGRKLLFKTFNLPPRGQARFEVHVKAKVPGDVRFKVDLWAKELYSGLPVHEEESTTIYTDLPSARLHTPESSRKTRLPKKR
jgi:uncharacterized repeat protein (TIGR01451 family)